MNIVQYLHQAIPQPCHERPFVCSGNPENCTVMIVGQNPVTDMSEDWWSYWNDRTGFDFEAFQEAYTAARFARGKARPVSNTRLRLNRFRAAGLNCIETNASPEQGKCQTDRQLNNQALLQTFVNDLPKLKAIVSHGSIAKAFVDRLHLRPELLRFDLTHFRAESYANIDAVIRQLA